MINKTILNIIFIITIVGCCLLLIPDLNNMPFTRDWVLLLAIEFFAQLLFNNITKK